MAHHDTQTGADMHPPTTSSGRLKHVGPGLIAAATGVGAGDIVASLGAGGQYGTALLWAIVLGAVLKFALAEGVGRWHLASESTILHGWRMLGRWTLVYFGVYIVIWGFSFGAAAMSASALPLNALFPALSVRNWGIICGLLGFALVLLGQYGFFRAHHDGAGRGHVRHRDRQRRGHRHEHGWPGRLRGAAMPDGSIVYVLGLLGGVGGSITLAAYGYWLREKGWRTPSWMGMMRFDNAVAYVITAVFVMAMMVMGAGLLLGSGQEIGGTDGIVGFSTMIGERLGNGIRVLFLVGFLAAAMTSLLGVWNGVSLLFADFVRVARNIPDDEADRHVNERSPMFRIYLAWLTFPPMALLFLDKPVVLVLTYAALGAVFMPFLAITLLWLLNRRVAEEYRSGLVSNGALVCALLLFLALAVNELVGLL